MNEFVWAGVVGFAADIAPGFLLILVIAAVVYAVKRGRGK